MRTPLCVWESSTPYAAALAAAFIFIKWARRDRRRSRLMIVLSDNSRPRLPAASRIIWSGEECIYPLLGQHS